MALGETAQLIVQLKLDDKISGPLRSIDSRLGKMGVNTALVGQGLGKVGRGLGVGLRNSAIIGAAGVAALSTQIVAGVDSLRELEDVQAQTAAGLKSTRNASGQTAESIRALAEEYETLGGVIDDKVIQSGENLLLTFTNIRKDAFEPALESALNLQARFGGDLQKSILMVGKALNDPVKGLTALGKAGVQFTEDQKKLIKGLVEENRLYDAQKVILGEIETQVGGSFAAKGRTGEATIARFHDAIEGLQQSLARGFLPVIDKVARRLTDLFNQPETIRGVRRFGEQLSEFFTDERLDAAGDAVRNLFGYLSQVPWGTIGAGLKIAGQAAKVAVDAFNALPKEVQGVVIGLLAANKLTGGLVSSGIGDIAKGLFGAGFKGLFNRGSTPATPLFTKEVGIPGGGVAGGPLGGAGKLGVALKLLAAPAIIAVGHQLTQAIGDLITGKNPLANTTRVVHGPGQFKTGVQPVNVVKLPEGGGPLNAITAGIKTLRQQVSADLKKGDIQAARIAQKQQDNLHALRGTFEKGVNRIVPAIGKTHSALQAANANLRDGNARQREIAARVGEARDRIGTGFASSNAQLGIIARKPTSFTANVYTTVNASISAISALNQMTRFSQVRTGDTGAGFRPSTIGIG